jgi:D-alanyl-D-alanine carboxypeptidase (penicillin-binding protein 5/6)
MIQDLDTTKGKLFVTAGVAVLGVSFLVFGLAVIYPALTGPKIAPVAAIVATSTTPTVDAFAGITINAKSAIVYDLKTKQVLYEKNANAQLPLASVTKLLTVYAASNVLSPSSQVRIGTTSINDAGDLGFTTGETFAFSDIARLALVASSNNAAEAIAETARARQATSTSNLLAGAASALGLSQTYAVNGTGLDLDTKNAGAYGSARDIAFLSGVLLSKAPATAHATTQMSVSATSEQGIVHTLPNTNPGIVHVPSPLLSKTGYTDLAGGNLVVVFDAGIDHPVAVVVLGSTEEGRFTDVNTLVSSTLNQFAGVGPAASAAL